jgi:riboflavin kinase / FMN adenylyltransferase
VIEGAVAAARTAAGVAGVLTFWPHPSALFRPDGPTPLIQDSRTKAQALDRLGVELVISQRFTLEFAQIEPEAFLPWLKQQLPTLAAVYVGENFRFGHKRRGDAKLLTESGRGHGITVITVPRLASAGEPVSSTRIRAHLMAGEIDAANALLGYVYFSEGVVTSGKRIGRTIGFPTLNLAWSPELRPRFGVYAVVISGEKAQGRVLRGVANYGLRPTVEHTTEPKLEVHVLDECPFGAGDHVTVEWLHFLRPEMKFADVGELRAQIARDRDAAAKLRGQGAGSSVRHDSRPT